MPKAKPKETKPTDAKAPIKPPVYDIDYFNYDLIDLDLPELPEGVIQLTPIQIKFDRVGQTAIGLYLGSSLVQSEYTGQKFYKFHKVMLPSGVTIGFAGCTQLDNVLNNLTPFNLEIHITFVSTKDLKGSKFLKLFDIVARVRPKDSYLTLAAPTGETVESEEPPF